ncbi:MAG: Fic family protein [Planctomycetota bacterium]|nr:Fic family protein [Planctomycetota bacterium]
MRQQPGGNQVRLAGYAALVERYGVRAVPNWHRSVVTTASVRRVDALPGGVVHESFIQQYWPGESDGEHLEFALKYDGTNLAILAAVFRAMDQSALLDFIRSRPTGKYARRLWYLYEWLTGTRLPLEDLSVGNYVDLLESDEYHVCIPARQVRRHRINDNLPGTRELCPLVRRSKAMEALEREDLAGRCAALVASYPPELLRRALAYLYTKETRSSFEIEREQPDATHTERFVALLARAHHEDYCQKSRLLELQHEIVDPRFQDTDYRVRQNYVGETIHRSRERIHYVCPSPRDVFSLMSGLIDMHGRMERGGVHPVVHAAAVAYGFVFIHPFEDGNGRIHRFLIHNILARRGFTPQGVMFPVSAAMLKDSAAYDGSLEAHSRGIMSVVEYSLDDDGSMEVPGDWSDWYRYPDMTLQAEALFGFVRSTIERELPEELAFLRGFDRARARMRTVVDLPAPLLNLFVKACMQNNWKLSQRKRESHFSMLRDDEVMQLEKAVRLGFEPQE